MHNFVNFVQISQSADNGECDLAQDRLRYRSHFFVDVIKRAIKGIVQAKSAQERVQQVGGDTDPLSMNSIHMQIC